MLYEVITDTVTQGLRQHGDALPGEIDTRPPFVSSVVEWGAFRDIIGHIGDTDPEAEVLPLFSNVNGVVEVLGRLPVDGDDRNNFV